MHCHILWAESGFEARIKKERNNSDLPNKDHRANSICYPFGCGAGKRKIAKQPY